MRGMANKARQSASFFHSLVRTAENPKAGEVEIADDMRQVIYREVESAFGILGPGSSLDPILPRLRDPDLPHSDPIPSPAVSSPSVTYIDLLPFFSVVAHVLDARVEALNGGMWDEIPARKPRVRPQITLPIEGVTDSPDTV
jgi:hypothetical protein